MSVIARSDIGKLPEHEARAMLTGTPTPDAESAARFAQFMKDRGLSADETLAKHGLGPAPVTPADGTPPAPPVIQSSTSGNLDMTSKTPVALSTKETTSAVEMLKKFWTGPPEDLEAAIKASGYVEPAADDRSAQERSYDAALGPPDSPAEYHISGAYQGRIEGADVKDLGEIDGELKAMLHGARVPVRMAEPLISAMLDSADAQGIANTSPAALAIWHGEQKSMVAKLTPFGDLETTIRLAAEALKNCPKAIVKDLIDNGSLDDHRVILQLALQGQRNFMREQSRRKP